MHFTILRNGNLTKGNLKDVHEKVYSQYSKFFSHLSISQKVHTNSTELTNCQAKSKFSKFILVLVFFVFSTLSIRSNDYLATMKQYRQPISVKKKSLVSC